MQLNRAILKRWIAKLIGNIYLVTVSALLMLSTQVAAQTAPQFKLAAPSKLKVGEPLVITLEVSQSLRALKAKLIRENDDALLVRTGWRSVKASRPYRIKHTLSPGTHTLKLVLTASTSDGESRIEFPLKVAVVSPINVKVSKNGLDASAGRLSLIANTSIAQAQIDIFDEDGAMIDQRTSTFDRQNGRGTILLRFDPIQANRVFRLELSIEDAAGQWKRFKFVCWFAEIPYDDVIFDSARWAINPQEAQKLDTAIERLNAEVAAFRTTVGRADVDFDVSLYVGGMTDTVGTKADNQRLSLNRAKAIAAYFRAHGLRMPIFIAGFGETGLRVATADEVEEARNRRAIYVLTSGTHPNLTPPSGRWQKY
jgi:outer membrane protein OmpA-like peptidoglycan-associated protein